MNSKIYFLNQGRSAELYAVKSSSKPGLMTVRFESNPGITSQLTEAFYNGTTERVAIEAGTVGLFKCVVKVAGRPDDSIIDHRARMICRVELEIVITKKLSFVVREEEEQAASPFRKPITTNQKS